MYSRSRRVIFIARFFHYMLLPSSILIAFLWSQSAHIAVCCSGYKSPFLVALVYNNQFRQSNYGSKGTINGHGLGIDFLWNFRVIVGFNRIFYLRTL